MKSLIVDHDQHKGDVSFLILSNLTCDPTQNQIWTLMVDLDQHTDIVSFVVDGCLKFDLYQWPQMAPRWPPIKNSSTPWKNLWLRITSPKFHQNLLNYVDEEAFWAYLNNDPKWPLDVLWPQIPEHPIVLHLIIIVSKYHENPSRHIWEEAFPNCERIHR